MDASKEECTRALITAEDARTFVGKIPSEGDLHERLHQLCQFLVAAQRKLPRETSYAKERKRRRVRRLEDVTGVASYDSGEFYK